MTTGDHSTESIRSAHPVGHDRSATYEIRVHGRLGSRWAEWFDGMDIAPQDDGTTVIRGPVADQAALHGVLHRLRDLGIPLVSLTELPAGATTSSPDLQDPPETTTTPGATS